MARHISATFVDPTRMRVEARGRRGAMAMDSAPPDGDGTAISPREALLGALAGCTSMDVASILRKKRQVVDRYDLEVHGEEATEHPQLFVAITVEHVIAGDVDPEAVRRSVELSATRYCPVSALLSKGVKIEHRYRLTRRDGTEHAALVVVTGPGDAHA
ncbi:MAG: OsmC family protein [Chloroflexota bacterium]